MEDQNPLEYLVEHALTGLCEIIKQLPLQKCQRIRNAYVEIVHAIPMTCWTLHRAATQHKHFEAILFYERTRLGFANSDYFLDGCPDRIALFCGEVPIPTPLQQFTTAKDRVTAIQMLEKMSSKKQKVLCTKYGIDAECGCPAPVCIFVARCKQVAQCARRRDPDSVQQCSNRQCNRLFVCNAELPHREDEAASNEWSGYWQMVFHRKHSMHRFPDHLRFCSSVCASQHAEQMGKILPMDDFFWDADSGAKKVGRARVAEAFRMALKRNEIASRRLRGVKGFMHKAVCTKELATRIEEHVSMMNVDLGLLYASYTIADSDTLSQNKLLPGSVPNWRQDPFFYARALHRVKQIYAKTRRKVIISNMLTMPKFLEIVQANAHEMF